ncbi:MAG: hypothetical protein IPK04_04175 [Bdellovibrionales bacterium]|nr:hypothetical protein [Bdellovibrionales bacterium]
MIVNYVILAILAFGVGSYIGCAEVKFSANSSCDGLSGGKCVVGPDGMLSISDVVIVSGGKVDILIVDDNSASMSFEQNALADRFSNFVNLLESKSIDYRLGITTTDISSATNPPRSVNQNGALQDGKLIGLDGGFKFVTPQTGDSAFRNKIFNAAIRRNETLECEKFILSWVDAGNSTTTAEYSTAYAEHCPSQDERGLYAANLVLKNNVDSFIRPEADLAIIVLSDEDVRSQLYWYKTPGYDLEEFDTAQGFVNSVKSVYPDKKFAVHAFLTKTEVCLSTQNAQTRGVVGASYGIEYYKVTQLTGGVAGSICSNNFTSQLSEIFNNITANIVDKIGLHCANPIDLIVDSGGNNYTVVGNQIQFAQKLPVGASVRFSYKCPAKVN